MSAPHFRYRAVPGVTPFKIGGDILLSTPQGGKIFVDHQVVRLWETAQDRSLSEIIEQLCPEQTGELQIRAGLACLAEAGLLVRDSLEDQTRPEPTHSSEPVSIILVSYNSLSWLEDCFRSIAEQAYPALEIILVDNASEDGSAIWVEEHIPEARLIRLPETGSFAQALNLGIKAATGRYYLFLNPDIKLERNAITELVHIASQADRIGLPYAAVAAKLRLLWAPGFINGLGNLVGALSWGTDIGLGHLDLGQFDDWHEVPSACFAAALISSQAYESVGPIDEGFPMYYEDSEWCYRARSLGFSILAAPQAVVYHAFNFQAAAGAGKELSPAKLQHVTYGRLRFIARINGRAYFRRFRASYFMEDLLRGIAYLLKGRPEYARALINGWQEFGKSFSGIQLERAELQSHQKLADHKLYRLQHGSPAPFIYKGLPKLTWDVICNEYLPLILKQRTRLVPEFSSGQSKSSQDKPAERQNFFSRSVEIARHEGVPSLVSRWGRQIQWRLMQP